MNKTISAEFPFDSRYVDVYGSKLHYIEEGSGDPILFLHGIPASCYVWRNIIPHLKTLGRCIAPDFIGMGKSDKPDIEYTVADQVKYLEKFIETLNLKNITLVMHGWGSVIGLDYAMRHPENCKGFVFYEAYLRPLNGDDISLPLQEQLRMFDEQKNVYDLVKDGQFFIDKVLPQEVMRKLTTEEISRYREPYLSSGSGKALCAYLKELPRANQKNQIDKTIEAYSKKLAQSSLPKLMLYSVPGFVTTIETLVWAKQALPNIETVDVGEELHYAQESNPTLMGEAISAWLQGIE